MLLAPTVNVFRSTFNGRNFESYAEDPFLTGKIAVAYIQGVQEAGVAATVKHYAGNESEYQRGTISSDINLAEPARQTLPIGFRLRSRQACRPPA